MEIDFQRAAAEDIEAVVGIMDEARALMAAEGRTQWDENYPARHHIESDVACGCGYVIYVDGRVAAYGAVIAGEEPAYASIEGSWLSESGTGYVVVHRLAVARSARGRGLADKFLEETESMVRSMGIGWMRVDTNFDNARMLAIIRRLGYTCCGKIRYQEGERLAFEKRIG